MSEKVIRAIAFHLPQFHPISENNEFWGQGFTEWTNVTQASPRFEGHYQPHLPADLGFYDLRLKEARLAQESYAKTYGISGFCYYHYWFQGKKVLNQPLDRKLDNPKEELPFMVCWANENWTRNWDGQNHQILLEQKYSLEDDILHFEEFLRFFKDDRYIKVNGKPVLMIYRSALFPDISKTASVWRDLALKNGLPGLYLIAVKGINNISSTPESFGFDAMVDFQPDFSIKYQPRNLSFLEKLTVKLGLNQSKLDENKVYNYDELVEKCIESKWPDFKFYPCVTPSWDNSARRKTAAIIFENATPTKYGKWLKTIVSRFQPYSKDENFIFINAWNEWAEGNHLEPCRKWGQKYLEETANALNESCLG
jgi:lipopolysaccharide biosynthesis protein